MFGRAVWASDAVKAKERNQLLIRLYSAMEVPGASSGVAAQHGGIGDEISLGRKAKQCLDKARQIIRQFYQGEDWSGSIEESIAEMESEKGD